MGLGVLGYSVDQLYRMEPRQLINAINGREKDLMRQLHYQTRIARYIAYQSLRPHGKKRTDGRQLEGLLDFFPHKKRKINSKALRKLTEHRQAMYQRLPKTIN